MKAILIDPETKSLDWKDVPEPSVKDDDVLIKIHAAALNRADLLQRKGAYPSPAGWPEWMGLEVAGTVEALGKNAENKRFRIGDRVCALLGGGGYAEYVSVPQGMVMPIPKGLSFVEASALPEAYATSYLNLFIEGHLQAGQTVFIPGGMGGLSSVSIPMAKAFGARVITSVRSTDSVEKIRHLGADVIIDTTKEDVSEVLHREADAGHPVNLCMDCLGGETMGKCFPYLAEGAYWVQISTLAGVETTIPLRAVLTKGLHLVGSMLRKRSYEEKSNILSAITENVFPKIESGEMRPSIYKVLPIEKAAEAHDILERGENAGKVVLSVIHD